jgi:hypothetical protein
MTFLRNALAGAALALALPAVAGPVDLCTLLGKADIDAVLGGPAGKAMPMPSEDPLRDECMYVRADQKMMLDIGTRPASEFDSIPQRQPKDKPAVAVAGLGQKAFQTPDALLVQPAGKPYFLMLAVTGEQGLDVGKTRLLASKLKLN